MKNRLTVLTTALALGLPLAAMAAPKAELWPRWEAHEPASERRIDHAPWTTFLQRHLRTDRVPHRLDYGGVSEADRDTLDGYLRTLEATAVSRHSRDQQFAYWVNLYNAATVKLVLEHYPVKSITKIKSGFFSFGPWDRKLLTVEGQELSLNDIEHRILRPIFADPRIHYAVNCASIGCPSLASEAFTAARMEELLDAAARRYINSPRGAKIDDGELIVSSIYDWFMADFGGDEAGVLAHLRQYADAKLRRQLHGRTKIDDYAYDWALNDVR